MMDSVARYMDSIYQVIGDKLISGESIYSGRDGHIRFAHECGYALNNFNENERKELLKSSYSALYVRGCNLKPILNAKEWIEAMMSQIEANC